jgi:hypothetical protein
VTYNDIPVFGVPKTIAYISYDLIHEGVDNEEKVKYFNMAKDVEEKEETKVVSI